ncbi:MAG: hypothetical protein AAFO84_00225 [Cyanobacteria bacterium J06598_1]
MKSDIGKLIIMLSILFLIAFPFAGLAPLTLLFLVGVCGWGFRLATTVISATDSAEVE